MNRKGLTLLLTPLGVQKMGGGGQDAEARALPEELQDGAEPEAPPAVPAGQLILFI